MDRNVEPQAEPEAEPDVGRHVELSVGEVARAARVSVRTLHHYDEIGLLRPGGRTASGYRLYDGADLLRLQRVLAYRELGFALEEIGELLDGDGDTLDHLRTQHRLLTERLDRLRHMVGTLATTMEAHQMGIRLTPQEMLEVFGDEDPAQYADEAQERWGETDAYAESKRRTTRYAQADWLTIKDEGAQVERTLADALRDGAPADGERATAAAEAHRQYLSRWFYDVSLEMHGA
jgi:DNA-binding transcriptional MerR regulator